MTKSSKCRSDGHRLTRIPMGVVLAGALVLLLGHPLAAQERGQERTQERGMPTGVEREQAATEQYVVRMTQFFGVSVHASDGDLLGQIEDVLITRDGRFNALIVRAPEPQDVRWQVPWEGAQPAVSLEQVVVDVSSAETDQLTRFGDAVAGTLGTQDSILATKLLEANVADSLGNALGSVVDLRVEIDGDVLMVLFGSPRRLADIVRGETELGSPTLMAVPWDSIEVQADTPRGYIAGAQPGAMIVVTGEGVQEEAPAPTEETGGAFIR